MAVGQFFDPDEGKTEFSPQLLLRSMLSQQVSTFDKQLINSTLNV